MIKSEDKTPTEKEVPSIEDSFSSMQKEAHGVVQFFIHHRKKIYFVYLFAGIGLFYLMVSKPVLKVPYLIEIFNR